MFDYLKKINKLKYKVFWMTGGIGNQLFIYAASKNVNDEIRVLFDLNNFKFDFREFKIDKFGFKVNRANWFHLLLFRPKIVAMFDFVFKKKLSLSSSIIEDMNIQQRINFNGDDIAYFSGYWQKYHLYKDVLNLVRKEYCLDPKLMTDGYDKVRSLIGQSVSVAIHIRRSDYLDPKNIKVFNIIGEEYYNACIREINDIIDDPVFFVFSEDKVWAKNNLDFADNHVVFVSDLLDIDYLEFDLMKQCKHMIIANSTFSWWAAELNDHDGKIIFAPLIYFKDDYLQFRYQNSDLLYNPSFKLR